jgi:hypothetical protein
MRANLVNQSCWALVASGYCFQTRAAKVDGRGLEAILASAPLETIKAGKAAYYAKLPFLGRSMHLLWRMTHSGRDPRPW